MPFDDVVVPYRVIADHYRDVIDVGGLQPGDPIPNGADLAREFDCHRTTAYKAIGTLKDWGYVISSPVGTFVAPTSRLWERLTDILNALERRGEDPTVLATNGVPVIVGKSASALWDPEEEKWKQEVPK